MKTFQQFDIQLKGNQPISVVEQIETRLIDNWLRDKNAEDETIGFDDTPLYCFKRLSSDDIPTASVWLTEKSPGLLSLSNVLPTEIGKLSYDEYNTIVSEFYEKMVKPFEDKMHLKAILTSPEIQHKDFLSAESSKLFRNFSYSANKLAGYLFSLDQQRWFSFIVSTHQKREALDPSLLERFLREEGWSSDWAIKLSSEYELARNILSYYKKYQENVTHTI